jgi:hypothetical protein
MDHKKRLSKLEKMQAAPRLGDVLTIRVVDYRAQIAPEIKPAGDAIPVRFIDFKQEATHEQP